MNWSVVLCEGPHDQAALRGVAVRCGGWKKYDGAPNALPRAISQFYPTPQRDLRTGANRMARAPDYITKSDCIMELRALDGDTQVLGEAGLLLTESMRAKPERPAAHAFVVDADTVGVGRRTAAFHTRYGGILPEARLVQAGQVRGTDPRVGLWVMPNNSDPGSVNSLLLAWADLARPGLKSAATAFVNSTGAFPAGSDDGAKATLGAIGQVDAPAATLATALRFKAEEWFVPSVCVEQMARRLCDFLDQLCGLAPAPPHEPSSTDLSR